MAARRLTPAQARERKARMTAICLALVFVVVAAIQGPTLLKALHTSSPAKAAAAAAPATGATTTPGATPAASPTAGQLKSFSRFPLQDPFHAQVAVAAAGGSSGASSTTPAPTSAPKPQVSPQPKVKPLATPTVTPPLPPAATTTTVPFTPAETPPVPPNAALITTNGKREVVTVGAGFPSGQPLFKLVGLGKKNVRIGVLTGSFTSGAETLLLPRGRTVTLRDQADATLWALRLVGLTTAGPSTSATSPTTSAPAATTGTAAPAGSGSTTSGGTLAAPTGTAGQQAVTADLAAVEQVTVHSSAADQDLAKEAVLQQSDFPSGSVWAGGPTTSTIVRPLGCGDLPATNDGIVITGNAESIFKTRVLWARSHATVLQNAQMVALDWRRSIVPGWLQCLRTELPSVLPQGTEVDSAARLAFPRVGTHTAAFRLVIAWPVGQGHVRELLDLVLFTRGRTEFNLTQLSLYGDGAAAKTGEVQMARLMSSRAAT
jgi:hypothetical protein